MSLSNAVDDLAKNFEKYVIGSLIQSIMTYLIYNSVVMSDLKYSVPGKC